MPNYSLTHVIDEHGLYYRVPICCINDPVNYSVKEKDPLESKPKPQEHFLNVSLNNINLLIEFEN